MTRSPKIWIAGILALSVFWCMVSLIAISRLETRLPSEMQEQLEFHASFSGLWPRSQADAGTDFLQQPPSLATEADDEVADDWSIWQPAVAALKAAFSAEQSDRQMLRGLRSVQS
ncbi:hypothetical protein WJX75_001650 [Coccomyxa subellipsoidea]|uniref:Uncharacterized protein n=1 Tax=Coccomyxa subellipsoidea TaxID=248742 RepID=A0ABR2YBB5_9CHLO